MQPAYQDVERPSRMPVAEEVMQLAHNLANRAEALADMLNEKLRPVMTSEVPRPSNVLCKDSNESQEYPPLFADLRDKFWAISSALDAIEFAMERTEL